MNSYASISAVIQKLQEMCHCLIIHDFVASVVSQAPLCRCERSNYLEKVMLIFTSFSIERLPSDGLILK